MSRLLVSFIIALIGHIYFLQFHFSLNDPSSPQLISDSSVSVTLNQYQEQQSVRPTQLASPSGSKLKQEAKPETFQPLSPQPAPKVDHAHQKPVSILPKSHKIKQEVELLPAQLNEAPVIVETIKLQDLAEPALQSQFKEEDHVAPELVQPPTASALMSQKLTSKTVSPSVIKARPLYQHNPKPDYPNIARRRGWEGIVMLEVEVTEEGKPATVMLHKSCGYKILDKSALRTVKKWRFLAGITDGKPATTTVIVPIHFMLQKYQGSK